MPDDLAPVLGVALRPAGGLVEHYARKSHADSTWVAYEADWAAFVVWCEAQGLPSRPAAPAIVADYAIHLATQARDGKPLRSIRYVRRAMAAIGWHHTSVGIDPPPTRHEGVRTVLAGLAREHGRPAAKRTALSGKGLRKLIDLTAADTLAGKRDRAMLALGYWAALRRSELIGLDWADVVEVDDGLEVLVRHSKTDKASEGIVKAVKRRPGLTDPVALYRSWCDSSGATSGAMFRPIDRHGHMSDQRLTDHAVAFIIKRACSRAGIDPATYSGHSLRRGFATSAASGGADGLLIRRTTGHKSDAMVNQYVEEGTRFGRHAQDFIDTGED